MITLHPQLVGLVKECTTRQEVWDNGVFLGDSESGDLIVETPAGIDVFNWIRGSVGAPRLTGATPQILQTFLAWQYGRSWRMQHGLPLLDLGHDHGPPPGIELTREPNGDDGLIIAGPPRVHIGGIVSGLGTRLARTIPIRLEDLIASFKHPDGLPAFPQHEQPSALPPDAK